MARKGSGDANADISVTVSGIDDASRALDVLDKKMMSLNGPAAGAFGGGGYTGALYMPPSGAPIMAGGVLGAGGGGVSSGGGIALPPGALAPNPLMQTGTGGVTPSGMPWGSSGRSPGPSVTIINNGGSVSVGGGNASPSTSTGHITSQITQQMGPPLTPTLQFTQPMAAASAAGWPGGVRPAWAASGGSGGSGTTGGPGGGNGGGGGSNPPPLPPNPNYPVGGWNPFGTEEPAVPSGYAEAVHNSLAGQSKWQYGAGKHFLNNNDIGKRLMKVGNTLDSLLPDGMMASAGEAVGVAAPYLAAAMAVREIVATGVSAYANFQQPQFMQGLRERENNLSGGWYDPIDLARDRQLTRIGQVRGFADALDENIFVKAAKYIAPPIAYFADYTVRNRFRQLEEDANSKDSYDKARRDFRLRTGMSIDNALPDEQNALQLRNSYNSGLGMFANVGGGASLGVRYGDYGAFADDPGAVNRSASVMASAIMAPGFESHALITLRGGGEVRRGFDDARSMAIAGGDWQSLQDLLPEYVRRAGGDLAAGQAAMARDQVTLVQTNQARTAGQITGATISAAGSQIEYMRMSGASGFDLARATKNTAGLYGDEVRSLQAQLHVTTNPLQQAQIRAQIAQARAGGQSALYNSAMQVFDTEGTIASTASSMTSNLLTRAMYGSERDVIGAFGGQRNALGLRAALLRDESHNSYFSPEQRAAYAAELGGVENTLRFDLPRQIGQFRLGLRQGEISVAGAGYSLASQNAALYGGVGDVYNASLAATGVIRSQLDVNRRELRGEFGERTQSERLDLQRQQIDLQRQLNSELEQSRRSFASANLSVASFTQGMTASRAGYQMSYFGASGGVATDLQGGNVTAARGVLAVAQANFDAVKNLPPDNEYRRQREQELQSARAGVQSSIQDYAHLGFSPQLEREHMAGQFRLGVLQSTYATYGDVRGTTVGLLNNVAARGRQLSQYRAAGLAQIDGDATLSADEKEQRKQVLLRDFDAQKYALGNEAVGYQQQLEQGYMSRMVSMAVNMPSRGAFVASQYTRRESAPWMQTMNAVFGEGGKDGAAARDFFMFRGDRLASSVIGNVSRPEGFMATALAGGGVLAPGGAYGHGAVGKSAKFQQALRLFAEAMSEIAEGGGGGSGNPMRKGGSTNSIHDYQNNAPLLNPPYPAGTSRQ